MVIQKRTSLLSLCKEIYLKALEEAGKPHVGDHAMYHFSSKNGTLVTRPAIIVRTWPDTDVVQLVVFVDGCNDILNTECSPVIWRTSVHYSKTPVDNTWSKGDEHPEDCDCFICSYR